MKWSINLCAVMLVGLCMLMVPAAFAQTTLTPDQYEPNNTQSAARKLGNQSQNIPNTIHANLHGADDQSDWYSTTVSGGSPIKPTLRMSVRLTGIPSDFPYEVTFLSENSNGPFDPSGEVARSSGTGTVDLTYTWNSVCGFLGTAVCQKTIYIHVRRAAENAEAASYDLTVTGGPLAYIPTPSVLPQVLNFTPTSGPVGTTVMIVGGNFTGTTAVKFKEVPSTFTITADNSISATVPPGAITGFITVVSPAGGNSSSSNFTVTSDTGPPQSAGGSLSLPSSKKGSSKKDSPLQMPSRSSGGESGPTVKPNPAAGNIPGIQMPTMHGGTPCCNIVANGALKGRLGRVVVAFPDGAVPKSTPVEVFKDGKKLQSGYGNKSWELLSGTYEVSISGKQVPNVMVRAGHDTIMKVGVLRVTAEKGTSLGVSDGGKVIFSRYGSQLIGLPIGSFEVKVGEQIQSVTISEGTITDF